MNSPDCHFLYIAVTKVTFNAGRWQKITWIFLYSFCHYSFRHFIDNHYSERGFRMSLNFSEVLFKIFRDHIYSQGNFRELS